MNQTFLGNEQMTVDNKGRVGIPARFMAVLRSICPDRADAVGVMTTPDGSIKIMPLPYFESEVERWQQLNDQVAAERMVLNLSTSLAEVLALDQQNRVKLNPLMMEMCSINKQVVITGSLKYMQLYDLDAWKKMYQRGLSQWGTASTEVAHKGERPATIQYVINAPATEPPGRA